MPRMTLRSLMRALGTAHQQVDFLQWYRASLNGTNLEEVAKPARLHALRSLVRNPPGGSFQDAQINAVVTPRHDRPDCGISPSCFGPRGRQQYRPTALNNGKTMELLDLQPPDYGVYIAGLYIIADDGEHVFAGPFDSETAAIAWITQRQDALRRRHAGSEPAIH
jgi:hypothetical protein